MAHEELRDVLDEDWPHAVLVIFHDIEQSDQVRTGLSQLLTRILGSFTTNSIRTLGEQLGHSWRFRVHDIEAALAIVRECVRRAHPELRRAQVIRLDATEKN